MLIKSYCKECYRKHFLSLNENMGIYTLSKFLEQFEKDWKNNSFGCIATKNYIYVDDPLPPDECPFRLEMLLDQNG